MAVFGDIRIVPSALADIYAKIRKTAETLALPALRA
jgi:hypothetical protein